MTIAIFLGIIAAGLSVLGISLMQAFKGGAFDDGAETVPSAEGAPKLAEKDLQLRSSRVQVVPGMEKFADSSEAAPGGIISERCKKLEQILEEKNLLLVRAEQELANERTHRGEFDSLKEILQRQIEDLKAQNKRIREDLARALQESAPRVSTASLLDAAPERLPARPEASAPESEKFEQFFNSAGTDASALSLHDIFERKQKPFSEA